MRSKATEEMLQRVPHIQLDEKSDNTEITHVYDQNEDRRVLSHPKFTKSDLNLGNHDILDLERIADRFHEKKEICKTYDKEAYRYLHLKKVDYEKLKETDRVSKQAYDLLFKPGLERYPHIIKMTEELIERLERRPHLYCPYERRESTKKHVSCWLNNHTNNPVAELCGFTSKCLYEPKRFIPTVSPRVSNSDTNIVLGKRKRTDETEVEDGQVLKSSSETRLVCDEWYRPKKCRRHV